MGKLNRRQYVVSAQVKFADVLDQYEREFVQKPGNLASSTQDKYLQHIRKHIRPAFGDLMLADVTTVRIDAWLGQKAKAKMAWSTRTDLRNIMSGIFTQADNWGLWKDRHPVAKVTVGRKRMVREKRKLTSDQTRSMLAALPEDVAVICKVALFCTLRISEVLGLRWKHIDFERGLIMVRERWYRGDIDVVKTQNAERDVPMGYLADELRPLRSDPEEFCFSVLTHVGREKKPRVCRDDRGIQQHFLRPTAEALKIYYQGFGFHAFRREAITGAGKQDPMQAMKMGGHSKLAMTELYTLRDHEVQDKIVRSMQEEVLGLRQNEAGPAN